MHIKPFSNVLKTANGVTVTELVGQGQGPYGLVRAVRGAETRIFLSRRHEVITYLGDSSWHVTEY